jgi:hypothetical protein
MNRSPLLVVSAAAAVLSAGAAAFFALRSEQQSAEIARLRTALGAAQSASLPTLPGNILAPAADPATPAEPALSLDAIMALSDPARRIEALMAHVAGLSADQLPAAIESLRRTAPDWDPEAKTALHLMLTRWAREDPDAALASLDQLGSRQRGDFASSVLSGIAAIDPARATAWLADPANKLVDFPFMGHILAGTIGREWLRRDPDAALAWAAQLPDSQRGGAYTGILVTLAGTDPARAASAAAQLEPGDTRRNLLADIGESWARTDPAAALTWVQSLSPEDRPAALRDSMASWAASDPAAAARHVANLPPEQINASVLKAVAEPWTVKAPQEAATWVWQQPDSTARNEAIGGVLWNWTKQNPEQASQWLRDQPPSPARDSAIGGLAIATFDSDPAAALTWADTMNDPKKREDSVGVGLREWLKRDEPAAASWAHQHGRTLPPAP